MQSWIQAKKSKELQAELQLLVVKYITPIQAFKRVNCKELVPIAELNGIKSLCNLFDAYGTKDNGIDPHGEEFFQRMCEMWFLFCVIWSIGASVDEDGRKKLDAYIRELEGTFPNKDTVYEYYVDTKQRAWVQWEEKLRGGWKYNPDVPFYKIIVPTVDTVRYNYLVEALIKNQRAVLLSGPVGTGKTSVAQSVLSQLDPMEYGVLVINMSAQTSSNMVQEIIESRVEKRTKGVYVPIGGKKMVNFMDDFNMPAKDVYGSQPPLELIRQWLDFGFWYDRKKQTTKYIKDVLLMASMGPPGGGRTAISRRLQSRFNLINMTFPHENEINRIFGSMISQKLLEFDDEFKPLGDLMTKATLQMYETVVQKFLPTPTKIHYLFNLRDISKVFQGLLRCDKKYYASKPTLVRLWVHECFRLVLFYFTISIKLFKGLKLNTNIFF
jgi:dynein heavy chain